MKVPCGDAERRLGVREDVVPQPRLEMALELGQVEGRRRALGHLQPGAMEDVEAEVEQRARHRLAVDQQVALVEVPAARPDHQRRRVGLDRIELAARRVGEVDAAVPQIEQVGLALDHVGESRRGRVLEIGHEHLGARVERVDDHLAVDRAGDLDPPVEEVGGDRRDLPAAFADRARLDQEVGQLAGVEALLPLGAPGEQLLAARVEAAMQVGEEGEGRRAEDFIGARPSGGANLDPGNGRGDSHGGTSSERRKRVALSLAKNARLRQGNARRRFQ